MAAKKVINKTTEVVAVSRKLTLQRVNVEVLTVIPEEEVWLASRKSARTRQACHHRAPFFTAAYARRDTSRSPPPRRPPSRRARRESIDCRGHRVGGARRRSAVDARRRDPHGRRKSRAGRSIGSTASPVGRSIARFESRSSAIGLFCIKPRLCRATAYSGVMQTSPIQVAGHQPCN
jgi:hypothetical protein